MPSTSRRLAVLCAVVAALIVGRPASAQAASNDFVLSYAASHLQPGMHFEFTVLADFGTLGSEARRGVYPDSVPAHEPAALALRRACRRNGRGEIVSIRFPASHRRFAWLESVALPHDRLQVRRRRSAAKTRRRSYPTHAGHPCRPGRSRSREAMPAVGGRAGRT